MGDPLDKLPAISSIASYFANTINDTYLAGLWSNNFLELLLWRRGGSATRSPSWRAPSWSFFSVDGHIHFPESSLRFTNDCNRAFPSAASVISCEVKPSSELVTYGRISTATLVISGRLLQIELSGSLPAIHPTIVSEDGHTSVEHMQANVRHIGSLHSIGFVLMDTPIEQVDKTTDPPSSQIVAKSNHEDWTWSQPLWFFMVGVMDAEKEEDIPGFPPSGTDSWLPIGLALTRLPNGNFQRIGFARGAWYAKGIDIFQNVEPQIITIV